jgi:hypothetical protein
MANTTADFSLPFPEKEVDRNQYTTTHHDESYLTVKVFGRTFKELNLRDNAYDHELVQISKAIEANYKQKLSSHKGRVEQVRVQQWVKRLCDENVYRCLENESLLRNRNTYTRLLHDVISTMERLEGPFRKLPPSVGEELPILAPFEVSKIERMIESYTRVQRFEVRKNQLKK